MVIIDYMTKEGKDPPKFLAMQSPSCSKYIGSAKTIPITDFNNRKVISCDSNSLHVALEGATEERIVQKTLKTPIAHVKNWAYNTPTIWLGDQLIRNKLKREFPDRKLVLDDEMFKDPQTFEEEIGGPTIAQQSEKEFIRAEQATLDFMWPLLWNFSKPTPHKGTDSARHQTKFIKVIASSEGITHQEVIGYPDMTSVHAKRSKGSKKHGDIKYKDVSRKIKKDDSTDLTVPMLKVIGKGINLGGDSDGGEETDEEDKTKTKLKKETKESKLKKKVRKGDEEKGDVETFNYQHHWEDDLMIPPLTGDRVEPAVQVVAPNATANSERETLLLGVFFADLGRSFSSEHATEGEEESETLAEAWFRDCLGASSIMIDKPPNSVGPEGVTKITITGPQEAKQTSIDSGVASFSFTTDKAVRERQFDSTSIVVTEDQTPLGYDARTNGLILGLETLQNFTLGDLLTMVQYPAEPWVKDLLSDIPLAAPKPGSRSGLWFQPEADLYTVVRVKTSVSDVSSAGKIADLVKRLTDLHIQSIEVIGFAIFEPANMLTGSMVMVQSRISLHVTLRDYNAVGLAMVFSDQGIEFTLKLGDTPQLLESCFRWLDSRLSHLNSDQISSYNPTPVDENHTDPVASITKQFDSALKSFCSNYKPRRIQMAVGFDYKLTHFSIDMQSTFDKGAPPGKHGLLNIAGQLWRQQQAAIPFNIDPFKEDFIDLKFDLEDAVDGISISRLIDSEKPITFPKGIPSVIKRGYAGVAITDGSPIFTLKGSLLDSLDLHLQYQPTKETFIQFRGSAKVETPPDDKGAYDTIVMRVVVSYDRTDIGRQWRITASARDIKFAALFSFFREDGSNYSLTDFMSQLAIPRVEVEYVYTSQQPSELLISGSIKLGPILLQMDYKQKKGEEWSFEADVRPDAELQGREVTMKFLLSGLLDDLDSVPEFITNLALSLDEVKGGIKCYSVTQMSASGQTLKYSVFSLELDVGDFSFTFAQIQRYDTFEATATMKPPTRILRFGITGFPEIADVMVVGNFKPPFDELDVLWVSADLTQPELDILNQKAFAEKLSKPPVLLQSGCHFQVLLHESSTPTLVLDYAFRKSKQSPQDDRDGKLIHLPPATGDSGEPAAVQGDTVVAPLTKTSGPLSVRSISVKATCASRIVITIDGSVTLGPVGLALLGFAVGLDFATVKNPSQLMNAKPDFSLDGMAVVFDRAPVRLAGLFSRAAKQEGAEYRGGIAITVGSWSAIAMGAYEELQTYKSLFAFGVIQGPLVEFGCAEIKGVAGGFGYNSHLTLPDVDHVTNFPLVAMNKGLAEPKGDIMLQLIELTSGPGMQCITPEKDSLWLAAGISIKALQVLDVLAVLALDPSSDPKFGLIAEATAIIPKGVDREKAFVVIELHLIAVVDPGHGLLTVTGQLTPRSYILSPSCSVTGGFCIAYFFEGSGHEGDWVLSIGGYHPSFQIPAHYPPTPPRLGISWVYDNELSITGEAYFAITPAACMGGGRLDAVFSTGRTKATFSAYTNFLMYFRPFHFQSEIGVSVYASTVIGWRWFSVEIQVEISAMLELHGPPIAGVAHLHFWFLEISVRFGPDSPGVPRLTTSQFLVMIKQAENDEEAARVEDHLFSIQRGEIANNQNLVKKDPVLEEHVVRASQLQLNIQSRFPILDAACNNKPAAIQNFDSIFISPMQIASPVTTSTLKVTVTETDTNNYPAFSCTPIIKKIPSMMWKKYEGDINPSSLGNSTNKTFAMGIMIEPEKSAASNEGLAAYSVIKFSSESIFHPVPEIKSLETAQMTVSLDSQSSQNDEMTRQRVKQIFRDSQVGVAQQNVLDCWSLFKARYTGGGWQFASPKPSSASKATMPPDINAMLRDRFAQALPVILG
ncbi:hypothetical protein FOXG_08876 [Fusarium oxysporum f. sp. lycopersici 4287]|uniref:DUF6603 domain-containing protein n=1 Tax=Fusarium oxysporum f. sp. lycopersici (strain 4287 / CBS 123668 / FGSC 9935 / NRRL 34936) TaxID=426428 RepID=A0A0J9WNT0_FUSO4|nr:hypothetical protein FOXG_08876 [Fusarium oxysporum f. sp. lycopersici 4287]KAJ9417890.1 hypothetical protein QL093DRAFT_2018994 [Fusarium oxysporum]KNB07817.1 hypothetical protein FOXG_08876 [Fusarium oxysporum f. sp. lycopersici 4287]